MLPPFANEPFTDFSNEHNAAIMREAIANVESQLGREYPLIIGGKRYTTGDMLSSSNPSKFNEVIGLRNNPELPLADKCSEEATKAYNECERVTAEVRARVLFKTAAIM